MLGGNLLLSLLALILRTVLISVTASKYFEDAVSTQLLGDITTYKLPAQFTAANPTLTLQQAMFKAIIIVDDITYYCERVTLGTELPRTGLLLSTSRAPKLR
jgi:hypothetical protein